MPGIEPWLIVGLGNPGPTYAGNRHNVGFLVLDVLAARLPARFSAHRSQAEVAEGRLGAAAPGADPPRLVLAKPRAYMNESGGPVAGLRTYYKTSPERIVVVHDELDLPFASLRLKLGGGDNGHNGLKSLRRSLGTGDFFRVRFGIGRPPGRMNAADYVLRDFASPERAELPTLLEHTADAVETLLLRGLEAAQQQFNS